MDLFLRIKSSGGAISPALNKELRESYGGSIEATELERVAAQILETGTFSRMDTAADAVTAI